VDIITCIAPGKPETKAKWKPGLSKSDSKSENSDNSENSEIYDSQKIATQRAPNSKFHKTKNSSPKGAKF
jgi:hypothetical protein